MKTTKFFILLIALAVFSACSALEPSHDMRPGGHTGEKNVTDVKPAADAHSEKGHTGETEKLSEIERPQKIKDMMASRGEQDAAAPTLKFIEPTNGATINGSTVKVRLELGGDLKGYRPMKDPQTQMGNHIHIILDNQPYEAHYNLDTGFELRNVANGEHTLRVFPSRPWHESYKNEGAFQMIRFTVNNSGADISKPTVSNAGETMANVNATAHSAQNSEGKDMANSTAGAVDISKPLLEAARANLEATIKSVYPPPVYSLHHSDAFYFPIPDNCDCIFLFNPFNEVIMSGVAENIQSSLQRNPRPMYILYQNPLHKEYFTDMGFKEVFHLQKLTYLEGSIFAI